ncbi:MAG: LysR family transcriptional regulator [Stappiaceae bacterium]
MDIPQGFDLRALRIFVTVADAGGMTPGAQRLSMTQSGVSQVISGLEKAIGGPLFDRAVRPLALTGAGNILYARASELLSLSNDALHAIRKKERKAISSVTVSMAESLAGTIGPALVRRLQTRVTRWHIWSGSPPENQQALLSHSVDMIITANEEIETVEGIDRYPVLREPFVLVFPADYDGPEANLDQVEGLPFIRYTLRSTIGRHIEQQINRLRLKLPFFVEFDTVRGQLGAVSEGMGWSITTPMCLLQEQHRLEDLRVIPLKKGRFDRRINLAVRQRDLGDLPQDMAAAARNILRKHKMPMLLERIPWLEEMISWPD